MDKISEALKATYSKYPGIEKIAGEPMKNHTSFRIGGPVSAMFFPKREDEVAAIFDTLGEFDISPFVMGNGTNLLVSDEPLDLVVINTMGMSGIEQTGECEITASAGATLAKLAVFAMERGLAGLEFAHGIPGSLGGAVYMNAGAYGGEMKDVVRSSTVFSPGGGVKEITGSGHSFSYRHSRFSDSGEVVLSSVIKLSSGGQDSIRAQMDELSQKRRASQPLDMPSAGSVFKRPVGGYAGTMIEQAGLKGYMVGGAQVSEKHAGFIVNKGGATCADVLSLVGHIQEAVFKQFQIRLETEIKRIP
ncbi:MAG: UDP-N-acetylmuramate dehydrogenase [Oscillospiraceae bacterium]|nr:UDP-N-acetylmuramate dehydrogenase [Oscillospiraceae bacterium]